VTADPHISVVVPCRDDTDALAQLLPQLVAFQRLEVIVVSAGKSDAAVKDLCTTYGARHSSIGGPRGLRLRTGAAMARAPYLWFLHADASLPVGAVDAVIESLDRGAAGGYFRFYLTGRKKLQKKIVEWSVAVRCRFGGVPYGDQALFVQADEYKRAGGHEPIPLFEEVKLVRWLQRTGRFHPLVLAVGVNPVRWDREGYAVRILKNRYLAFAYMFGVSTEKLARSYFGRR